MANIEEILNSEHKEKANTMNIEAIDAKIFHNTYIDIKAGDIILCHEKVVLTYWYIGDILIYWSIHQKLSPSLL